MSGRIVRVDFRGKFDITGVVNWNGVVSRNGADNHRLAKTFQTLSDDGTGYVSKDYTGNRCLKQAMFSDLISRRPTTKEMASDEYWVKSIASLVGILRGDMNTQFKPALNRKGPLTVMMAETIGVAIVPTVDQGSSTKPKESDLIDDKGGKKGDTSMFQMDAYGRRYQKLVAHINLQELQFIDVDPINNKMAVRPNQEAAFVTEFAKTLDSLGVSEKVEIKDYVLSSEVVPTVRRGVLLSPKAVRGLVLEAARRLASIAIIRATGALFADHKSIEVDLVSEGKGGLPETKSLSYENLAKELEKHQFKQFYEPAAKAPG